MKRPYNWLWIFVLVLCIPAAAANLPSDWRHEQSFDVSNAGLVKISLPVETLDAARPALEDLRLYDGAGNEVPYFIQRPAPEADFSACSFFMGTLYSAASMDFWQASMIAA